jgi:carnitine 3-dehydrogenase
VTAVPERVAVVGAGEIGSGWAALFAAHGAEVRIFDRDHEAATRARAALTVAVRCGVGSPHLGAIDQFVDLDEAVRGAGWVQESLPERLDLKRAMLGAVARTLAPDAILASSTSTFTVAQLAAGHPAASRLLVVHPLHPVYAVPLVEIGAGPESSASAVERADGVMRALGRSPVVVRGDLPGLVANRLTAALLREAFDLVARGAIGARELDVIVRDGIALGWTAAGAFGTEAVGAGGSFARFVEHFAPALERLWDSLAEWRSLTPERRAALLTSARELGDHSSAHDGGEAGWAETLARIARAARDDEPAT